MTPNSLPFWSPVASQILQTSSQKGLQKAVKKQLPKMDESFVTGIIKGQNPTATSYLGAKSGKKI